MEILHKHNYANGTMKGMEFGGGGGKEPVVTDFCSCTLSKLSCLNGDNHTFKLTASLKKTPDGKVQFSGWEGVHAHMHMTMLTWFWGSQHLAPQINSTITTMSKFKRVWECSPHQFRPVKLTLCPIPFMVWGGKHTSNSPRYGTKVPYGAF